VKIRFGHGRIGEAGDVNAPFVIAVATVAHAQDQQLAFARRQCSGVEQTSGAKTREDAGLCARTRNSAIGGVPGGMRAARSSVTLAP
jgi:hypothetical protein